MIKTHISEIHLVKTAQSDHLPLTSLSSEVFCHNVVISLALTPPAVMKLFLNSYKLLCKFWNLFRISFKLPSRFFWIIPCTHCHPDNKCNVHLVLLVLLLFVSKGCSGYPPRLSFVAANVIIVPTGSHSTFTARKVITLSPTNNSEFAVSSGAFSQTAVGLLKKIQEQKYQQKLVSELLPSTKCTSLPDITPMLLIPVL